MSDIANKKLGYTVEADFDNVGKAVRELMGVFKTLDKTFKDVGKQFETLTKDIKTDAKSLEKPFQDLNRNVNTGFKEVIKELKRMGGEFKSIKQDMKNALGYVQQESKATGRAINRIAQETTKTGKAVKSGMDASAKAMKSFAAENKKTQTQLRGFNDEVKRGEPGLKNMRNELSNAMASFGMVAGAISGALTMSIRGVMKEFGEFEHQMKVFQAVSQSTVEELAMVEAKVKEIGANTQFTATEVALASVELSKMGFTAQEVTASLDGMVYASIASGESLADTSEIIATTIRTFGMAADDATKVADIIARGANISGQSFASYAQSMKYLGSAAAGANQDLVEISGMLSILADRGLKFSVAGNGMQNALLRLQAPTAAGAEALERFNIALENTQGTADKADDTLRPMMDIILDLKKAFASQGVNDIEQAGILKDLFGEVALNSMQVFMNTSNEVMDSVMEKQRDYAGSSKETAETISESFESGVKRMESAISALQISLGEQLAPTMSKLADSVQGVANAFNDMPKPIQSAGAHLALFLAGATAVFAGVGGLGFLLNQAISGFGSLNKMMDGKLLTTAKRVFPAIGKFARALVTGPFAEVIIVAGTMYAAFKTNFGGIADIFNDFFSAISEEWLPAWYQLFEDIGLPVINFGQLFSTLTRDMSERFFSVIAIADQFFGSLAKAIASASRVFRALIERDFEWLATESEATLRNVMDALDAFDMNSDKITKRREAYLKKVFGEYSWEAENRKLKEATDKEIARIKAKRKQVDAQNALNDAITKGTGYTNDGLDKENKKVKLLKDQLEIEEEKLDTQIQQLENEEKRQKLAQQDEHNHGSQITLGASGGVVTSGYGNRTHPVTGQKGKMHHGVDYGLPMGADIKSDAAGKIAFSGWAQGYGNTVIVDAGNGNYLLYGHASKLYKKVGDTIKKGDTVAAVGSTGTSTAPHLHAEIRKGLAGLIGAAAFGAKPVNPSQGFTQLNNSGSGPSPIDFAAQKAAVETQRYQLYLQHQQQVAAILPTIQKGTEQYAKAQDDLAEATKKVTEQEGILLDLQLNAKDIKAKMVDDQLKNLKEAFEVLSDEQAKSLDEFGERYDELKKKQEDSTKTIQEIQTAETIAQFTKLTETVKLYESILVGLKAKIEAFKEANKTLTKDQQKELSELEKQYADIEKSLKKASDAGEDYLKLSAIEGAQEDWEKIADSVLLAGKAKIEFFRDIQENEEALKKLNAQVNAGEVDLEKLAKKFKLTEAELKKLIELLAQVQYEQDVSDEDAKWTKFKNNFERNFSAIRQIMNEMSDFFYQFNSDMGRALDKVTDVVGAAASGFGDIMEGVLTENKEKLATGGITLFTSYWSSVIDSFQAVDVAAQNARQSIRQANQELLNAQTEGLGYAISNAERGGGFAYDLRVQQEKMRDASERMALANQINEKYGSNAVAIDPTGNLTKGGGDVSIFDMQAFNRDMALAQAQLNNMTLKTKDNLGQIAKQLAETYGQTASEMTERLKKQAEEALAQGARLKEYLQSQSLESQNKAGVDQFIAQFDSPEMQEAMRSVGEKFIAQRNQITSEVWTAMYDGTMGSIVEIQAEITRRINKELPGLIESIEEQMQKVEEAALKNLESNANRLKDIRKDLYDQQKKPLDDLIKAEQRRLDEINQQNKAIEEQIRLKNKERDAELAQFDAEDQGKFAALVAGVDYPAALRQGLDDIHNTEGVLTGTYSGQSHKEAIDERIALMTLENENRLKLEQQTRDEYLAQQQNIAALQARFAEEALRADDLTNRQRLELEQTKADAYVNFQRAYREAITERFEAETSALQRSIDKNNEHKATIQSNIDQYQRKINALTSELETSLAIIDDRIGGIIDSNTAWILSVDDLRKGIEGPMNKIIGMYERAKELASSFGGGIGSSGGSYNPYGSTVVPAAQPYNPYGNSVVPAMAGGGVVPDGYPNDSFLARLQSKEWVLPEWITKGLTHQFLNPPAAGGGRSYEFNLYGDFREPGSMEREVINIMNRIDRNGDSGYNGAFQSSLN